MKRMRNLVIAGVVLVASGGLAPAAQAGSYQSTHCSDGIASNGTEFPLVGNPVTFDIEVGNGLSYLQICYSTTPRGSTAPAVTGGVITVYDSGHVGCWQDTSPVVFGLHCQTGDDNPGSVGRWIKLEISLQGSPTTVGPIGGEVGTPSSPACIRGFYLYAPTGVIGPYNIGVC
jgi:hypothetical protein